VFNIYVTYLILSVYTNHEIFSHGILRYSSISGEDLTHVLALTVTSRDVRSQILRRYNAVPEYFDARYGFYVCVSCKNIPRAETSASVLYCLAAARPKNTVDGRCAPRNCSKLVARETRDITAE